MNYQNAQQREDYAQQQTARESIKADDNYGDAANESPSVKDAKAFIDNYFAANKVSYVTINEDTKHDMWAVYRGKPTWADYQNTAALNDKQQWIQAAIIERAAAEAGSQSEAAAYWKAELQKIQNDHGFEWRKIVASRAKAIFEKTPTKTLYGI